MLNWWLPLLPLLPLLLAPPPPPVAASPENHKPPPGPGDGAISTGCAEPNEPSCEPIGMTAADCCCCCCRAPTFAFATFRRLVEPGQRVRWWRPPPPRQPKVPYRLHLPSYGAVVPFGWRPLDDETDNDDDDDNDGSVKAKEDHDDDECDADERKYDAEAVSLLVAATGADVDENNEDSGCMIRWPPPRRAPSK